METGLAVGDGMEHNLMAAEWIMIWRMGFASRSLKKAMPMA